MSTMVIPSPCLLLLAVLLLSIMDLFVCAVDSDEDSAVDKARLMTTVGGALLALYPGLFVAGYFSKKRKRCVEPHRKRTRRSVSSIFKEMGPTYVRRAYRMHEAQFWKLHRLLKSRIVNVNSSGKKKHRNGGKNGLISSEARLSCALRYFAGGRPDDIAVVHGISHSEVFNSVWKVVNAVNECDVLAFSFPDTHEEQQFLAAQFAEKSRVGFKHCVGAIDGMLIWIEKPSLRDCTLASVGQRKFFCGRKHKFGLNLMATCDTNRRFLDISIKHPASTSDYLAFCTSSLYSSLEQPGYLAEGLCIFGDNAYVNTRYMATPFRNVSGGNRDNYNYYHSSLRISIECAFGMLVNRWSILRRALPASLGLDRIPPLIMALCRLHNFLIEDRLSSAEFGNDKTLLYRRRTTLASASVDDVPTQIDEDALENMAHGQIPLEPRPGNRHSPEHLLHGGEHSDDVPADTRRQDVRRGIRAAGSVEDLPRSKMLQQVIDSGFTRPRPKGW